MMLLRNFLMVGAGGALGSMARYGVSFLMNRFVDVPYTFVGTFTINVIGSFLIGLLFGLTGRAHLPWLSAWGYLLLASGFCGGFTTFSTFALENINILQRGQFFLSVLYMGLSLVVGLLLCRLGIMLAGR